jgi:hypothetical protein
MDKRTDSRDGYFELDRLAVSDVEDVDDCIVLMRVYVLGPGQPMTTEFEYCAANLQADLAVGEFGAGTRVIPAPKVPSG